jgi:hypothetical protein
MSKVIEGQITTLQKTETKTILRVKICKNTNINNVFL